MSDPLRGYEYYRDDKAVIYCGDCREIIPHLKSGYGGGQFVYVTDPPYGVGFTYESYVDSNEAFTETILPTLNEIIRAYPVALCMSFRQTWRLPTPKWSLCWYKPGSTRRNSVGGFSTWEPVLLYGQGWKYANDAIVLPAVMNYSKGNQHPCPKPLALFRYIVKGAPSGVIIDPFMGSGTTLRAAKDLGMQSIGIELEEKYCEIAVERLRQRAFDWESSTDKEAMESVS